MGNVFYLEGMRSKKLNNEQVIEKMRNREAFKEALRNAKETSGIDFFKLIMGDEQEKRKYEMKMRQAALDDND